MMLANLPNWVTAIGTILPAMGGIFVGIRKMLSLLEKSKREQSASILKAAKENDAKLELKIHELDQKIDLVKENAAKDISHLKETYGAELKFLGQKIDGLRQEVSDQHGQIVALLTKMIGK